MDPDRDQQNVSPDLDPNRLTLSVLKEFFEKLIKNRLNLGRHMDHLEHSHAKLCQGGTGWYVGRESISMDNSPGEECEPVIVFESLDLSVGLRVDVS